jgi:hypothetical protein
MYGFDCFAILGGTYSKIQWRTDIGALFGGLIIHNAFSNMTNKCALKKKRGMC